MNELLKKEIESVFKDVLIADYGDNRATITIKNEQILPVLRFLNDKGFDHLALLSAVDWIEQKEFELVYILTRYMQGDEEHTDKEKLHLIVKTRISRQRPQLETATAIFPNAEPYEREIHELFGITFEGHKRLTPLLLERDYEIPPFRKDFDTREYVKDAFDKIPFIRNEKE